MTPISPSRKAEPMSDIKPDDETRDDREFEARVTLERRGVHLVQFHPFTLEQIEALAELVKSWEG
jgi:hypothetical protein